MLCFVIILCIIVLLAILLYTPFYYDIEYKKDITENRLEVKFKILGITVELFPKKKARLGRDITDRLSDKKSDMAELVRDGLDVGLSQFIKVKSDIADALDYMTRKSVKIKLLDVGLRFGFEDAAVTGVFTGVFNAVIYNLLGFVHRHITIKSLKTNIVPDFNNKQLEVYARCIIRLRTVNIIIVLIKWFKISLKLKKGVGCYE